MELFETNQVIALSLNDPVTGNPLMANTYTLEGVMAEDGVSLRQLSLGQLVMAICLARATALEASIIDLMNEMEATTARLEAYTEVENTIVEALSGADDNAIVRINDGDDGKKIVWEGQTMTYKNFLQNVVQLETMESTNNFIRHRWVSNQDLTYDNFISGMESKMDALNSFSQEKMIELQSQTNKRDQSYDMISNILKSFNTQLTGNANNL